MANFFNECKLRPFTFIIALASSVAHSQNGPILETEEILVKGIRASLGRSVDVKRNAAGVVDAISAEDIGKFPDTNLAESLQRITGVSINRRDGEGQQVTVRGFGPQFNAVSLNGRQMPNSTGSRGFNFDTVAAEMVRSIHVFKTVDAGAISGGVGSFINVKTARPFDLGDKILGQFKAITDTSNSEPTPSFSGVYSANFNDTFAALMAVSYQQRRFNRDSTEVRRWEANLSENGNNIPTLQGALDRDGNAIDLLYLPTQHAVVNSESNRQRTNANITLQYAPSQSLTASLDLNYSDLSVTREELESVVLKSGGRAEGEFWELGENGTPAFHQFVNHEVDFFTGAPESREVAHQVGVNLDWDISDLMNLSFDIARSAAESNPNQERIINRSGLQSAGMDFEFINNGQSAFHTYSASQVALIQQSLQQQDVFSENNTDIIDQARLDFTYEGNYLSVAAGIMYTDQTKTLQPYNNNTGNNADAYNFQGRRFALFGEDGLYATESEALDAGYEILTIDHKFAGEITYISFSAEAAEEQWRNYLINQAVSDENFSFGGLNLVAQDSWSEINEQTFSAFFQTSLRVDIIDRPLLVVAGVRVENTAVSSIALESPLQRLEYVKDNEDYDRVFGEPIDVDRGDSYNVVLPSFSLKYEIADELITRLAVSQSITRPELSKMKSSITYGAYREGEFAGIASAGNPDLEPFLSNNFDISAEWYFSEVSYLSVGYFHKAVDNFIVDGVVGGAETPPDGNVFISDRQPVLGPNGQEAEFIFEQGQLEARYLITRPRNAEEKAVGGFELAVQFGFGNTGFGVLANATLVDTDAPWEVNQNDESALLGLSNSANLVGFYENHGLQARIAYNWRDVFIEKWGHFYPTSTGEPTQVEAFSQIDITASYEITPNFSVFLEGINITSEDQRTFGRYENQTLEEIEGSARYALGVRTDF